MLRNKGFDIATGSLTRPVIEAPITLYLEQPVCAIDGCLGGAQAWTVQGVVGPATCPYCVEPRRSLQYVVSGKTLSNRTASSGAIETIES